MERGPFVTSVYMYGLVLVLNRVCRTSKIVYFPSIPPSTIIGAPVTKSLAELARNINAPRRSLGSPHRSAGVRFITKSLYSLSLMISSVNGVLKYLDPVSRQPIPSLSRRGGNKPWTDAVDLNSLYCQLVTEGLGHLQDASLGRSIC